MTVPDKKTEALRDFTLNDCNMSLFGVAGMEGLRRYVDISIEKTVKGLDHVVVVGLQVSQSVLDTLDNAPQLLDKQHDKQLNYKLDRAALDIAEWILHQGYSALPIPASQTMDRSQKRAHFSHRHAAFAAGLGFQGRHSLLVTPEYGAQVRLVTVITNMPLTNSSPMEMDCGSCRACIEACPAKAISEKGFDFDKCYAKLRGFKGQWGIGQFICGVCLRACRGRQ